MARPAESQLKLLDGVRGTCAPTPAENPPKRNTQGVGHEAIDAALMVAALVVLALAIVTGAHG